MPERLSDKLIDYLSLAQGKIVFLDDIRKALHIESGSPDDTNLRTQMSTTMVAKKIVSPSGRRDGSYKVVRQVSPVQVFSVARQRRAPFELKFPRDWTTGAELSFAEAVVIREGDLVTIGGTKSSGKTQLVLDICAENIDLNPVLMGNEYTVLVEDVYEPAPRFLARMDKMSEWVEWVNEDGMDKFILLPVREDFAEHIRANRLNLIDWINLDASVLYDIGTVLEGIKRNGARGVSIVALQKGEGAINPRGGQFVRDFSDLEILLDVYGKNPHDVLLTLKGVKESTKPIVGKTFAYTIGEAGTKIFNFREVRRCSGCSGSGIFKGHDCDYCLGIGQVDA